MYVSGIVQKLFLYDNYNVCNNVLTNYYVTVLLQTSNYNLYQHVF